MHVTIQYIRTTWRCSLSTVRGLMPLFILIVLIAGAATLDPAYVWCAEPEIVARVNGEPVTRAELQRLENNPVERPRLLRQLGIQDPDNKALDRLALKKLIHRRLLLQEAGRRNIIVTDSELDQAIASLRHKFADIRSLGTWMKEQGLEDKSLIETIRADMLVDRVWTALAEGVRVTEEEVLQYYDAHKEDLKTEEVRLQIIVVKDRATAEEILKAVLNKREDFGRMARQRSVGLRAARGGDTGWVDSETLRPPLREAVGALKPREAVGPLQRGDEFLIVRLEERRLGNTKSSAEAQPDIERRLLAEKQQEAGHAWLMEQEKKSKIEVFP